MVRIRALLTIVGQLSGQQMGCRETGKVRKSAFASVNTHMSVYVVGVGAHRDHSYESS